MDSQPILTTAFIGSFVVALLNLLVVFGVPFTPDQVQAIQALVGIAAPVVVALVARSYVDSPKTRRRRERDITRQFRGH